MPEPTETRVVQLPLDSVELELLTLFAGIGAGVINAMQRSLVGDAASEARAVDAYTTTAAHTLLRFQQGSVSWERWRAVNRRIAKLAAATFPDVPVQWFGDARPGDEPRPGEKRPEAFADLASLGEDERIQLIGKTVVDLKKTVAVCVDDEPGKPERYVEKMRARFPGVALLGRAQGPVAGVVTLKFGPQ